MKIYLLTILTSLQLLAASANENPNPTGNGVSLHKKDQKRKVGAPGNGFQAVLDRFAKDVHPLTFDQKLNRVEVANVNAGEIYEYSFDGFRSVAGILDGKYISLPNSAATLSSVMVRKAGSATGTTATFLAGCAGSFFMNATSSQVCDFSNGGSNPTTVSFNGLVFGGTPNSSYTFKLRLLTTVIQTTTVTTDGMGSTNFTFTNVDPDPGSQNYQLEVNGPSGCTVFPAASSLINCRAKIEVGVPFGGPYCTNDPISFTATKTQTPTAFDAVSTVTGMTGISLNSSSGVFTGTALNTSGSNITSDLSITARYTDGTESCPTTVTGPAIIRSIPVISAHPADITVCSGSPANFSVTASGNVLSYQWKENGSNVGTNQNSYTTPNRADADNGKQYVVVISNECTVPTHPTNAQVASNAATLTVNPGVASVDAGPDQTVCYTGTAPTVNLTAAMLLTDGTTK